MQAARSRIPDEHVHRCQGGTLSPDEGALLTALLDAGGFALERGAASLVIRSYMR